MKSPAAAPPQVLALLFLFCLTFDMSRSDEPWDDDDNDDDQQFTSSSWTPREWDDDQLLSSSSQLTGSSSSSSVSSKPWISGDQLIGSSSSLSSSSSFSSQPWEKEWASLQRPQRVLTKGLLAGIAQELSNLFARANLAGYIRLIFHDCAGGCNGCINFANAVNRGLESEVADLEGIYQRKNYENIISRADFWAYAAQLAVEKGLANSQARCHSADCKAADPGMVFRYGRKDCPTSPFTTRFVDIAGPRGQDDTGFFAREFGFTDQETVAIMGAHNMALARTENSGYSGMFVAGQTNLLNNNYYKALLKTNYVQVPNTPTNQTDAHFQWNLTGEEGFMLNTDLGLWKDIRVDSTTGRSGCPIQSCGMARTSSHVLRYANNNDAWVRDFAAAFVKMISRGNFQLFDIV